MQVSVSLSLCEYRVCLIGNSSDPKSDGRSLGH